MAGLNNSLINIALGYDDYYKSTIPSRELNFKVWNSCEARPNMILQLRGEKIVLRPPGNEGECVVSKIVAKTLELMCTI